MSDRLYPLQIDSELGLPYRHQFSLTETAARKVFAEYEKKFSGQSFEELHNRGGFGILEALYLLTGERVHVEEIKKAGTL